MSSLYRWITFCNRYRLEDYVPFRVEAWRVGFIARNTVMALADYPSVFQIDGSPKQTSGLTLRSNLKTQEQKSQALEEIVADLVKRGLIASIRKEFYPVFRRDVLADLAPRRPQLPDFESLPLFLIDRGAIPFFGLPAWGVHLNGYTQDQDTKQPHSPGAIWSARRAKNRPLNPGRLDNMVAGGQPWGLSFTANLAKEAREEATIGPELIARARPASLIAYCVATPNGLEPATMACYDLALPEGFHPHCADGEIASFHLWDEAETLRLIAQTDEFKPNANLCGLDFLLRHGAIPPDHPDYERLQQAFLPCQWPSALS